MKAIQQLSAYGNPAQSLRIVEVSKLNAPSAREALSAHDHEARTQSRLGTG
jgi:hypothetical protein